jgi:competence protein ComEA
MDASSVPPAPVRPRLRLTVGAAVVLLLLGIATTVLVATLGPHGSAETVVPGARTSESSGNAETSGNSKSAGVPESAGAPENPGAPDGAEPTQPSSAPASATIFVHILGEVVTPGLYELRAGDRAIDVVAAAGGLTDLADDAQLNLARFLTDGEQIIVPKEGEAPPPPVAGAPSGGAGATGGLINLNLATADELEDLPGVGPELAGRVVDWREANGRFGTVDDLRNVAGFGEKKLEALRDSATT